MDTNQFARCSSHVSLLPHKSKATFINIIKHFFFCHEISYNTKVLDHNNISEKENIYLHRGMILISMLIQLLLINISKPLKKFRTLLEDFLNNGVTAQRDSDKYMSFLGHSDSRLDLDKDIKREDARYYPALSIMASKLAYENEAVIKSAVTNHWEMEFVGFYNFYNEFQHKSTTQAFIFRQQNIDNDMIIVTFRGTSMFVADDWSTDFDFSWIKIDGMGKAHMGFMIDLGLTKFSNNEHDLLGDFNGCWPKEMENNPEKPLAYYKIREKLKEMLENNKKAKFIVTGHSLGGALAILFPSILGLHGEKELLDRLEAVYTYGQPRVGDEEFGRFMKNCLKRHNIKYYRIVYGYDIVPKVPFDNTLMTFKHFGKSIHFNSLYHGKIVDEEKEREHNIVLRIMKRVIVTLINFVVARLNGVWELIRGLFIGYVKGPDYREGWLLIFLRITGILVPSFINHFPQDYVNSTRLMSQDLFTNFDAFT